MSAEPFKLPFNIRALKPPIYATESYVAVGDDGAAILLFRFSISDQKGEYHTAIGLPLTALDSLAEAITTVRDKQKARLAGGKL